MTLEKEFISLTSDTTFKYLYKNNETRPWIDNIIKKKFGLDLSNYKLSDNESNTGNKKKDYRFDINLKKDDSYLIVEMNNDYYAFVLNKSYQYLYRLASSLYKEGEKYKDKSVKLIMFNNFKNRKIPDLKIANLKLRDKDNNLEREEIESYEIYLPNFKELCYHNVNKEDISLSLFICTSYNEMRSKTNNPDDLKIIEELERLSMDDDFIFDYHCDNDEKLTKLSMIDERLFQVARNMLQNNESIEKVISYTNLPVAEVERIKEELKQSNWRD